MTLIRCWNKKSIDGKTNDPVAEDRSAESLSSREQEIKTDDSFDCSANSNSR
jgi:hypothetical protein